MSWIIKKKNGTLQAVQKTLFNGRGVDGNVYKDLEKAQQAVLMLISYQPAANNVRIERNLRAQSDKRGKKKFV